MTDQTLRIDIVSDVMCPWCIIGYRQLAQALEATGTPHEIHWHPFELNPEMPPEGQNTPISPRNTARPPNNRRRAGHR